MFLRIATATHQQKGARCCCCPLGTLQDKGWFRENKTHPEALSPVQLSCFRRFPPVAFPHSEQQGLVHPLQLRNTRQIRAMAADETEKETALHVHSPAPALFSVPLNTNQHNRLECVLINVPEHPLAQALVAQSQAEALPGRHQEALSHISVSAEDAAAGVRLAGPLDRLISNRIPNPAREIWSKSMEWESSSP